MKQVAVRQALVARVFAGDARPLGHEPMQPFLSPVVVGRHGPGSKTSFRPLFEAPGLTPPPMT